MSSPEGLVDETASPDGTGSSDGTGSPDGTRSSDGEAVRGGDGPRQECTQALEAVAAAALSAVTVAAATLDAGPLTGASAGAVTLVGCLGVAAVTPALVRIDIAERRLPNVLVGVAAGAWGVSTVLLVAGGGIATAATSLAVALVAAVLGLVAAIAGGLGMGDVKLGAVLSGLVATGSPAALLGLYALAGTFAVGVAGVRALGSRSRRAGTPPSPELASVSRGIPFGPCLLAAFWCVVASPSVAVAVDAVGTVP